MLLDAARERRQRRWHFERRQLQRAAVERAATHRCWRCTPHAIQATVTTTLNNAPRCTC
jgi:hypothetical protein